MTAAGDETRLSAMERERCHFARELCQRLPLDAIDVDRKTSAFQQGGRMKACFPAKPDWTALCRGGYSGFM
ncbi:MAG: hypothetical protein WCK86_02925 [Planctomycetia bacterium]